MVTEGRPLLAVVGRIAKVFTRYRPLASVPGVEPAEGHP